jgi:hypothetical protein
MKVVKLNRRFRQYKKHGHVIAVRCDSWLGEGIPLEKICDTKLGAQGYTTKTTKHIPGYNGFIPKTDLNPVAL